MLRSWCESSRALATLAAILFPAALALAAKPPIPRAIVDPQAEAIGYESPCPNGMCPVYAPPRSAAPADDQYVIIQPGCEVIAPPCCEVIVPEPGNLHLAGDCCDGPCSMCDCCCPVWTIRAEALLWDRVGGGGVALVNAPVAVTTDDFDFPLAVGPRLTVIRHGVFDTAWDLEFAYFFIDGWSDTVALADIDDYQTTPQINIGGVTPGVITYDSTLDSGEVNLRRDYNDWLTWLAGFRWVQVDENLNATFGAASHNVEVNNRLFGGQLGVDALLWTNGADLDVTGVGKAGIYANSADQTTTTVGVGGALPLTGAADSQIAFVGELGINARYRMSDRWTAIGGYNLLWISGVALAPDQLATTNITTGVATVDLGGGLFYHGANAGIEYVW